MSNSQMNMGRDVPIIEKSNINEAEVVDLGSVFKALWYKKWLIISFTALVSIIAMFGVSKLENVYKASALMQIDQNKANYVSIEDLYGGQLTDAYVNTQIRLIKSRPVLESVVKEMNLVNHKEFKVDQNQKPLIDLRDFALNWLVSEDLKELIALRRAELEGEEVSKEPMQFKLTTIDSMLINYLMPPRRLTETERFDRAVAKLSSIISTNSITGTQLIQVSVKLGDPYTAATAANKLVEAFIASRIEAEVEANSEATKWMNERLVELKAKLKSSELKLQKFKEDKGLLDLGGIVTVSAGELSAMNARLIAAKTSRAEIENQYIQIRDTKSQGWEALASIPAVITNPLVQSSVADEERAKAKVAELSERYGSRHPLMQSAKKELSLAETNLKLKIDQVVAGIEKQYQIAKANEQTLQRAVWQNKSQVEKVASNEYQLNELKRDVQTNQALYDTFLTRLKEASVTSDIQMDLDISLAEMAFPPAVPIYPNRGLIVTAATIVAFILMVVLLLILKSLNNTFKEVSDVESELNLSVLGMLPKVKSGKSKSCLTLYNDGTDRIYTESVNTLRTNVVLSSLKHGDKKLLVTSSIPSEGKSTTATNLAFSLSKMEKVLLIESDMRKPNIAKNLGIKVGSYGLANVLAGNASLGESIHTIDGLDVIPAGTVPPDPLNLLLGNEFKDLLDQVVEKYDRIVIDSPPIQAVSDASVLSQVVDGVIYVVKGDHTSKDLVKKGVGLLLQSNAPLKGVVVNLIDVNKSKKQGYQYDGYYDYYGYSK